MVGRLNAVQRAVDRKGFAVFSSSCGQMLVNSSSMGWFHLAAFGIGLVSG